MTMQERKGRVERLATEPLFFYRTLRETVEELDSTKAKFQWLLAAYEKSLDPAIRAQYEAEKRADRTLQLQTVGSGAPTEATKLAVLTDIAKGVAQHVDAQIAGMVEQSAAGQEQVIPLDQLKVGNQTVISGLASFKLPDLKLSMPGNNTAAADETFIRETVRSAHPSTKEKSQEESSAASLAELGTESILEAKRIVARHKVAEEVSKLLAANGITLSDVALYDYMDNRMSKEDLAAITKRVMEPEAEIIEPGVEFDITQVGHAQKMVYSENGFLAKILGSVFHRYGKGSINTYEGFITVHKHPDYHNDSGVLLIPDVYGQHPNPTRLVSVSGDFHANCGVILKLKVRSPEQPYEWLVFLPAYRTQDTTPPMIYALRSDIFDCGFIPLSNLTTDAVSDITNRIVHALVDWHREVTAPKKEAEQKPAEKAAAAVYVLPADSKEYPQEHNIGKMQALLYGEDGLLKQLLGPQLHFNGSGPVNKLVGMLNDTYVNTDKGQGIIIGQAETTGVYMTRGGMKGVLIRRKLDQGKSLAIWLPLRLTAEQSMPSFYVSEDGGNVFYNFDSFLATERYLVWDVLATALHSAVQSRRM